MTKKITLKFLLIILLFLSKIGLKAEEVPPVTIHVETAGTLPTLITNSGYDIYKISNLTLTGNLNGTDIRFIRDMAGKNYFNGNTQGKLIVLDLANTNIVKGGNDYYYVNNNSSYKTTSNEMSSKMFADLSNLTSITIPNSVTTITYNAFDGCIGLKSVNIGNSTYDSVLDNLIIESNGNSYSSIYGNPFFKCSALEEFVVAKDNTKYCTIDGVLFSKDETKIIAYPHAKSIHYTIPEKVSSIGESAFYGCTGLISIEIPNSITSIGDYDFYGCTGLINMTIPESVTSIGESAFSGCIGLINIEIPNSVTSIENQAFYRCSGLTCVTIPNSVVNIGNYTFAYCTGLISIEIPNSITLIDDYTFYYCTELTSVIIPNSVMSIGERAFYGCNKLSEIHSENPTPPHAGVVVIDRGKYGYKYIYDCFSGINKVTCKLYVAKGSKSVYQSANQWQDFINIIEEGASSMNTISKDNLFIQSISNGLTIETKEQISVSVYNLSGEIVYQSDIIGNPEIFLEKGIYIVSVNDESQKIIVK